MVRSDRLGRLDLSSQSEVRASKSNKIRSGKWGKVNVIYRAPAFVPGVLHRLSYLIPETVTILISSEVYR